MKKYILLSTLVFFCMTSTGMSWSIFGKRPQKQTTTSVNATVEPTPTPKPKPTIQEGRNLVRSISLELKAAKEENLKLQTSLDSATSKIQQAEEKTAEVQKAADSLKEWGINQQIEAQKYFQKYNDAVKRYHRLKLIASIIAAAGGVLLGLQFMNFAPPPYNIGVPVGSATLFGLLVWFFL